MKMKVMWICNLPNKSACEYQKIKSSNYGGWLTGLSDALKNSEDISLVYCYPKIGRREQDDFVFDNVHYYSFYTSKKMGFLNIDADKDDKLKRKQIKDIIQNEQPDIIHIFGTEYVHALITAEEVLEKEKLVCSIQGLTSIIAKHYLSYIPTEVRKKKNFSSLFRRTLQGQQMDLIKRGKREIKTLQLCSNIIGRTDWDYACTHFINPSRIYYKCNETLRSSFYTSEWHYEQCNPTSIFVSQGSSPLKGLNILLEAIALLKKDFPQIKLRIAGNNFIKRDTLIDKMKISTYGDYINQLIRKNQLYDNIEFLGGLNEQQMVNEYLRCNVFVSPSSIENSSNSIGEAMLLGVPVISSNVGGINSLLEDNVEGILYQGDAPYMLAMKIRTIFIDTELGIRLGKNARKRAMRTHDIQKNKKDLIEAYKQIYTRGRDEKN